MAALYLLHFNQPYWSTGPGRGRPARHYIGYTKFTAAVRVSKHRQGSGSRLVKYALDQGCDFEVVGEWEFPTNYEARQAELRIKKSGHYDRYCNQCRQAKGRRRPPPRPKATEPKEEPPF